MKNRFRVIALFIIQIAVLLGLLGETSPAFAQGCTVSSSTTTAGTATTACFVKAGNQVNLALTGTWVGRVDVQVSRDGGTNWVVWKSYTSTVATLSSTYSYDARIRFFVYSYTSGTIVYSITDKTAYLGKLKYSTVPIGSVAYGSFGTSVIGSATSTMVADTFVVDPMTATGVGVLVGGTGGTDKFIVSIYDSTGALVANSTTDGTTVSSSTNAFQEIAFTTPVILKRGKYFIAIQVNGATATTRRIAASTFVDVITGSVTASTFGTIPAVISPPTTFTALYGPIAYIY